MLLLACGVLAGGAQGAADPPPADEPGEATESTKEDAALLERLRRESTGQQDQDVMDTIARLMGRSAAQLGERFDPSAETQSTQAQILAKLEEAIQQAAQQRRSQKGQRSASKGDQRRRDKPAKDATHPSQAAGDDGSAAQAAEAAADVAPPAVAGAPTGPLHEARRAWGQLPQRDREEIIQGSQEDFLERYRAWIERYYRALQEADE